MGKSWNTAQLPAWNTSRLVSLQGVTIPVLPHSFPGEPGQKQLRPESSALPGTESQFSLEKLP